MLDQLRGKKAYIWLSWKGKKEGLFWSVVNNLHLCSLSSTCEIMWQPSVPAVLVCHTVSHRRNSWSTANIIRRDNRALPRVAPWVYNDCHIHMKPEENVICVWVKVIIISCWGDSCVYLRGQEAFDVRLTSEACQGVLLQRSRSAALSFYRSWALSSTLHNSVITSCYNFALLH